MAHHIEQSDNIVCLSLTLGLHIHGVIISKKYRTGIPEEEKEKYEHIAKLVYSDFTIEYEDGNPRKCMIFHIITVEE